MTPIINAEMALNAIFLVGVLAFVFRVLKRLTHLEIWCTSAIIILFLHKINAIIITRTEIDFVFWWVLVASFFYCIKYKFNAFICGLILAAILALMKFLPGLI